MPLSNRPLCFRLLLVEGLQAFLFAPMRTTNPALRMSLYFIKPSIPGEEYKSTSSSSQPPATSSLERRTQNFSHHPVVGHPHPISFSQCKKNCFTPLQNKHAKFWSPRFYNADRKTVKLRTELQQVFLDFNLLFNTSSNPLIRNSNVLLVSMDAWLQMSVGTVALRSAVRVTPPAVGTVALL